MKYSFHPKELSNWKGRIIERLVQLYIEDYVKPKLQKEGFDLVFRDFLGTPLSYVVCELLRGNNELEWEKLYNETVVSPGKIYQNGKEVHYNHEERVELWKKNKIEDATIAVPNRIKKIYLKYEVFPDNELYKNTIKLLSILNVATDGLLFKLNKTGKTISKRKAISGLYNENYKELPKKIPLVSGEIDVIEIKSDKAFIGPSQKEAYSIVIENGFKLRYFHVFIISFVKNNFKIEMKVLENVNELKETIKYFRNISQKINRIAETR